MASCCCIFCPEGTCPPDCPFLEVFPVESPFKTLKELTETGWNLEFVKECLVERKNHPDEQKKILERMIISHEVSKKFPLIHDEGFFSDYAKLQATKKKFMIEHPELNQRFNLGKQQAVVTPAASDS